MKRITRISLIVLPILALVIPLVAGVKDAAAVQPVPVAEFKEHLARVGMPETMRTTTFLGIERGMAVIEVRKMSLVSPAKWKTRRVTVKLDDLDPALRSDVELLSKIPAGADPSLLVAVHRMQPFAVPEGLARRGARPEFLLWLPPGADPKVDLSKAKESLEVLRMDPETGKLIPQREFLKPGGINLLPIPDETSGTLYWLRRPVTP